MSVVESTVVRLSEEHVNRLLVAVVAMQTRLVAEGNVAVAAEYGRIADTICYSKRITAARQNARDGTPAARTAAEAGEATTDTPIIPEALA